MNIHTKMQVPGCVSLTAPKSINKNNIPVKTAAFASP